MNKNNNKEFEEFEKFIKEKIIKKITAIKMYEILSMEIEDLGDKIVVYEKIKYKNGNVVKSFKKIFYK